MKEKATFKNIIHYIVGNFRYRIFYSKYFHWMMRNFIRQQIEYRINSMDRECFERGSCIKCGCQTTHLQMANKACKGDCYPVMVDKHSWIMAKCYNILFTYKSKKSLKSDIWIVDTKYEKFIKKEEYGK